MLTDEQFIRYQRQVALPDISEIGQQRLLQSHVLVIGCGGLGSAAALYLAGAGVGRLVLVDDDNVEVSNLHRQVAYRSYDLNSCKVNAISRQLSELNSDVQLRSITRRMEESQLSLEVMLADVVLDCSDNLATRQLVNRVCFQQKTPLISSAAIGWQGQFTVFDYQQGQGCYRCLYPFDELAQAQSCSESGVLGPVIGTLGNYQALAAIQKLALGKFLVATGQIHLFNGKTMLWQTINISQDSHCSVCGALAEEVIHDSTKHS
ncbi:HesA/MoeB/ThiF family protein [Vibrio fluminensis]|uniref:HesA/MoeB/ThiF family protein n=1 Tax=Vibrio fluminensis TaxID=2783614 RepID=UPI001886C20D|nr:HesA/MoeB/ThiF family protein [Vibrio fluminensis]